MKEATGEVSMTVITIVILAFLIGIGTWLFGSETSPARQWLFDLFQDSVDDRDTGATTGPTAP